MPNVPLFNLLAEQAFKSRPMNWTRSLGSRVVWEPLSGCSLVRFKEEEGEESAYWEEFETRTMLCNLTVLKLLLGKLIEP